MQKKFRHHTNLSTNCNQALIFHLVRCSGISSEFLMFWQTDRLSHKSTLVNKVEVFGFLCDWKSINAGHSGGHSAICAICIGGPRGISSTPLPPTKPKFFQKEIRKEQHSAPSWRFSTFLVGSLQMAVEFFKIGELLRLISQSGWYHWVTHMYFYQQKAMGWIGSTQTSLLISHVCTNLLVYDKIIDFSCIFGNTRQQRKEEK